MNAKNPFGLTALMFATRAEGGEAVARALLEAGADVNAKAENGLTALMEASRYGTSADVRAMLAAGADVNARAGDGRTALLHATMYNRDAAVVRALLEAGADKAPTDYEGHDALWHARKFKNGEIIRLLEGGAAKPAAMSDEAFVDLCREGTAEHVKQALADGANPNARNVYDQTALMWAALHDDLPMVQALLDAGADVNARYDNQTALTFWSGFDGEARRVSPAHAQVVRALLKAGADPTDGCRDDDQGSICRPPLVREAMSGGDAATIRAFLEEGGDARAQGGDEALMEAARYNRNPGVIEALLSAGAGANHKDGALREAASHQNLQAVRELSAAGVNRRAKDENGRDALWHAKNPNPDFDPELPNPKATRAEIIRLLEGGAAKSTTGRQTQPTENTP